MTVENIMHILITGAAGMVGRKLTERLVAAGGLNGKPIDRLTLVDVVAPAKPAGFSRKVDSYALDVSREDAGRKLVKDRPDAIFHLAAVVSGEAETDFEKGYRVNLDTMRYLLEAIRTRAAIIRSWCSPRRSRCSARRSRTRSTTSSTTRR
jgi:nucleoside-diphosphate-sugar epimerase